MAYIGSSPTKVVSRQSANIFTYTVSVANTTVFSGADDNGNTLACSPSDIMVHINGLRMEKSDFSATSTSVTLVSGAAVGDEVTITAFVTFETADAYTKSASDTRYVNATGDTVTGPLTVDTATSTNLTVDSGIYGGIQFKVAGTDTGYITSYTNGSGAEAMYIGGADTVNLHTGTNHALTGGTTRLQIDASGRVTMPYQPMVRLSLTSHFRANTNVSDPGDQIAGVFTVRENVGNHWSSSNNNFTCPVAGVYSVSVFYIKYPSSGKWAGVDLHKNGSAVDAIRWRAPEVNGGYHQAGGTIAITCAANDVLDWHYVGTAGIHSQNGAWQIMLLH